MTSPVATLAPATRARMSPVRAFCRTSFIRFGYLVLPVNIERIIRHAGAFFIVVAVLVCVLRIGFTIVHVSWARQGSTNGINTCVCPT